MSIADLIEDLIGHGVELWIDDRRLRCRGPEEETIPRLYAALRERKAEVLEFLLVKTAAAALHPLSYSQQSLWLLHELDRASAAYNVNAVLRVDGAVDIEALRAALDALALRHAILRTVYVVEGAVPMQAVREGVAVPVDEEDARGASADALDARIRAEVDRPFSLREGVLRVKIFRGAGEDRIALTVHHIAADFWSLQILLRELAMLYDAARRAVPVALPPLERTYLDHVRDEASRMRGPEGERLFAYWRAVLDGELAQLALPTDHPRPTLQTYRGGRHRVKLPGARAGALRSHARGSGTTPYTVMLSAFAALLHRYTGQHDLLVGTPAFGRERAGFAGVVGDFVNALVVRCDVSGQPTFRALVDRLRQTLRGALEHQDLPFSALVERLAPPRDPSRSPIFQVLFNWNQAASGQARDPLTLLGELVGGSSNGYTGATHDLSLTVTDDRGELSLDWVYNADLFDHATVVRMAHCYDTLLGAALDAPDTAVARLPLLEPEQRARLVAWGDRTAARPRSEGTVHARVAAQAARTPAAIAVACGDDAVTYAELDARANQLAHHLRELGAGPDVLVGLCCTRSIDMVVAMLGILKSGSAYVPLDPSHPRERLAAIVADTQLTRIVGQGVLLGTVVRSDVRLVLLDDDAAVIGARPRTPIDAARGEHLAYVLYTSGSTGQPKGVCIEHAAVAAFLDGIQAAIALEARDRVLATTTLAFDISVLELLLPLTVGARVVVADHELSVDGRAMVAEIDRAEITVVQATPAGWQMLLAGGWDERRPVRMLCGGEALSGELAAKLLPRGRELWNLYGPTEATVWVGASQVVAPPDGRPPRAVEPIGGTLAGTALYILDAHLEPVPVGVGGELYIAGAQLARGYWNRPELTEQQFVPHPFSRDAGARLYKTGDVVAWLPDGRIEFRGRSDRQVKIRGFRIELGEIEAAIASFDTVAEDIAAVHVDARGEKHLVAYVVPRSRERWDEVALRDALRAKLPHYMIPSFLVVLDRIPVKANGKVDRAALPSPDLSRHLSLVRTAPRSADEELLAGIWAEVLRVSVERIGIDDNFFELGGHSLLLARVQARLLEELGQETKIVDLYTFITIRTLAEHLRGGAGEPREASRTHARADLRRAAMAHAARRGTS